MFIFAERVHEDATNKPNASTAYNLSGTAVDSGTRSFASALSDGDECIVLAELVNGDGNRSGAWEIVECTYNDLATDTLTRGTLWASSSGSKIDWSSETDTVRLSIVNLPTGARRRFSSGTVSGSPTYITVADSSTPFRADMDYEIHLYNLRQGTDGRIPYYQVYTGGAWHTGSHYSGQEISHYDGTISNGVYGGAAQGRLTNFSIGNDNTSGAEERLDSVIRLAHPHATAMTQIRAWSSWHWTSGQHGDTTSLGSVEWLRSVTGIRFYPSTGTWDNVGGWVCWEYAR